MNDNTTPRPAEGRNQRARRAMLPEGIKDAAVFAGEAVLDAYERGVRDTIRIPRDVQRAGSPVLITGMEAVHLGRYGVFTDMIAAIDIERAYDATEHDYKEKANAVFLHSILFTAGRIAGIRQERKRQGGECVILTSRPLMKQPTNDTPSDAARNIVLNHLLNALIEQPLERLRSVSAYLDTLTAENRPEN